MASYDLPDASSAGLPDPRKLPDMPKVEGAVSYTAPGAGAAPALPKVDIDATNPVAKRIRELALEQSNGDEEFADLALRIARQESRFNREAIGPKTENWGRARGTLQVIEATFRENGGKNFDDPEDRDRTGLRFMWKNYQQFGRDRALTAAAHHAGPGAVKKAGNQVPGTFDKAANIGTKRYVSEVLGEGSGYGELRTDAPEGAQPAARGGRWRAPPIDGNVAYPEEGKPAVTGDRGLGTVAADLGLDAGAGGIGAAGSMIRGAGELPGRDWLKDAGAASPLIRIAQAFGFLPKNPGLDSNLLERPAAAVERAGKAVEGMISPQGQKLKKDSAPTGDLFDPSTWSMGKDPTLSGYGQLAANTFGQFLPQLLSIWLPKTGITMGALQGGGAAALQAREFMGQQSDETLLANSPRYRELVETGVPPAVARARLTREAEQLATEMTMPISALGGVATASILSKSGGGLLERATAGLGGAGGRAARGGATGVLSGLEEGFQEVGEGIATQSGINAATGMRNSVTEGSFGNFVQGALGGGPAGAVRGLMTGAEQPGGPTPAGAPAAGGDAGGDAGAPPAPGDPPRLPPGGPPRPYFVGREGGGEIDPLTGEVMDPLSATMSQIGANRPGLIGRAEQALQLGRPDEVGPGFVVDAEGNVVRATPEQRMADGSRAGDMARTDGWMSGQLESELRRDAAQAAEIGLTPDVRRAQQNRTEVPEPGDPAPGDVLYDGRRPFKMRSTANAMAKKIGGEVVPVRDGYVVRPEKPTPRQTGLSNPENVVELRAMAREAGWEEVGGKMLRGPTDADGMESVTRTKWIPRADWWASMANRLPNDKNGEKTKAAVEKAINGEKLTAAEGRVVDEMLRRAQERVRMMNGETDEYGNPIDTAETAEPNSLPPVPDSEPLPDPDLGAEQDAIQAEVDLLVAEADDDRLEALVEAVLAGDKQVSDDEIDSIFSQESGPAEAAADGDGAQEPVAEGQGGRSDAGGKVAGDDRAGADGAPPLELAQQTEQELRQKAEKEKRAAAEKAKKDAAPPPEGFKLTGSDRPADVGAAAGQMELGEAPKKGEAPDRLQKMAADVARRLMADLTADGARFDGLRQPLNSTARDAQIDPQALADAVLTKLVALGDFSPVKMKKLAAGLGVTEFTLDIARLAKIFPIGTRVKVNQYATSLNDSGIGWMSGRIGTVEKITGGGGWRVKFDPLPRETTEKSGEVLKEWGMTRLADQTAPPPKVEAANGQQELLADPGGQQAKAPPARSDKPRDTSSSAQTRLGDPGDYGPLNEGDARRRDEVRRVRAEIAEGYREIGYTDLATLYGRPDVFDFKIEDNTIRTWRDSLERARRAERGPYSPPVGGIIRWGEGEDFYRTMGIDDADWSRLPADLRTGSERVHDALVEQLGAVGVRYNTVTKYNVPRKLQPFVEAARTLLADAGEYARSIENNRISIDVRGRRRTAAYESLQAALALANLPAPAPSLTDRANAALGGKKKRLNEETSELPNPDKGRGIPSAEMATWELPDGKFAAQAGYATPGEGRFPPQFTAATRDEARRLAAQDVYDNVTRGKGGTDAERKARGRIAQWALEQGATGDGLPDVKASVTDRAEEALGGKKAAKSGPYRVERVGAADTATGKSRWDVYDTRDQVGEADSAKAVESFDARGDADAWIARAIENERGKPKAPPAKGADNKVFTKAAADKARELLLKKLSGGTLNAGLDPEVIQAGIQLAGFHIEAGARTFAAYARAMVADLGAAVKPYLKGWYLAAKNYPGFDAEGMDRASTVEDADVDAVLEDAPAAAIGIDWAGLREMPGWYGDADQPLRFASGMSRIPDFTAALQAGQSVGVEIGELSPRAMTELANALVAAPDYPYVFVDTGAFSVFRANLRAKQLGQEGFEDFGDGGRGLDFDAIMDRFAQFDSALAAADRNADDDGSTNARAFFVMPDIVGDQLASIELAKQYAEAIRDRGIRAIVPLQKGPLPPAAAFDALRAAVGLTDRDTLLIGVPSNERAFGLDDLRELVGQRGEYIEGLHFLGAAADAKLQPKLDVLTSLLYDGNVSADANRLRALISGGSDRAKAMRDLLNGGMRGRPQPGTEIVPTAPRADEVVGRALSDDERDFVDAVKQRLEPASGAMFKSINDVRALYEEITGRRPEGMALKRLEELFEFASVEWARVMTEAATMFGAGLVYDKMVGAYEGMPRLATRTSGSVERQAYSTPLPLAFLATRLARIDGTSTVYEPTAGTGMLLMGARPDRAVANELDADRAVFLREQGFAVTGEDASGFDPGRSVDVVIANPPFGAVKDADGESRRFTLPTAAGGTFQTGEIDHAIAMKALESMKDGGRAVLILGSVNPKISTDEGRADAYNGQAKRLFYFNLYQQYNVTQHFTVAGDLYKKQGAAWPVDVIVVEGRGKSALPLPAVAAPRLYDSWGALKGLLDAADRVDARQPGADGGRTGGANRPGPVADGGRLLGDADPAGTAAGRPGGRSPGRGGRAGGDTRTGGLFGDGDGAGGRGGINSDPQQRDPADGTPNARGDAGRDADAGDQVDGSGRDGAGSRSGAAGGGATAGNRGAAGPADLGTNANQVSYEPASKVNAIGTLMPVNMRQAVADALAGLKGRVGELDAYVARELGYKPEVLGNYFGAEQVDALALALDSISRGAGFVIGDQTGIGKGRVVAGVIRWALKNGKTPIFVTEKPNLYGDMYRDLTDIGVADIRPVMTNSTDKVPLDDEGKIVLKPLTNAKGALAAMAESGELKNANIIFTTYSQMQFIKGAPTERNAFLARFAQGGVVIFDESHNAGGQEPSTRGKKSGDEAKKEGRAGFARKIAGAASAVFYSSATWAKRPEVMDLYFKTDMAMAVGGNPAALPAAIQAGGVPLQQVVSAMLAKAGQYIRRERSFNGVAYNTVETPVDHKAAEAISRVMLEVANFDRKKKAAVRELDKKAREAGEKLGDQDSSVGQGGATSTNFTSIMHNLIDQMLLSLKVDAAVDLAITELKAGNKVVLTVANTMGSFIEQYVEEMGLAPGDAVGLSFRSLLKRYLDRSRYVTIKTPDGEKIKRPLTDSELGTEALAQFRAVMKMIDSAPGIDTPPISPIDWMHHKLRAAGFKTGEITGRTHVINYSAAGGTAYETRKAAEVSIAGRRAVISGFNGGAIDAVILNQAGSTGLSLHASAKFKDRRPRRMIIVQPERNIDTHMQMLGRVHRTGQVVLPGYSQLVADIPAEKRPAAVLARKMASLNASTTSNRKSAVTSETVVDFMNDYGDEVAAQLMQDMPDVHEKLGKPLTADGAELSRDNAVAKVTGRIPLLPLAEQEAVYALLESGYTELVQRADALGENMLEAKTLDIDARTVKSVTVFEGTGTSPFAAAANAEVVDVKRLGKPYTSEQANALIVLGLKQAGDVTVRDGEASNPAAMARYGREVSWKLRTRMLQEFTDFRAMMLASVQDPEAVRATEIRLAGAWTRFDAIINAVAIGESYRLTLPGGATVMGYVTGIKKKDGVKNPVASGAWQVQFALADAARAITLPMSKLQAPGEDGDFRVGFEPTARDPITGQTVAEAMDAGQSVTREQRVMMTGNLLAAFGKLPKGQIVNYTDNTGAIRQGIFMPRGFDMKKAAEDLPITFTPSAALTFLRDGLGRHYADTRDGAARVLMTERGMLVKVPKSKSGGGEYFLDQRLRELVGDFVSRGDSMVAQAKEMNALAALRRIEEISKAPLETVAFRAEAAKAGGKNAFDDTGLRRSARPGFDRNMTGNLFGARRAAAPTRAQDDALAELQNQLRADARARGMAEGAIDGLRVTSAPFATRPVAAALKKLFGVDVVFVDGVGSLPSGLDFDGAYVRDGRTVFVASDSTKPFHQVIGHEFLHWLKQTNPDVYDAFTEAVAPVMRARRANTAATERGRRDYAGAGFSESKTTAFGWEEVFADTFGEAWSDPSFWREMMRQADPGIIQKLAEKWRTFVLRVRMALGLDKGNPVIRDLYTDFAAVREAVAEAMSAARTGPAPAGSTVSRSAREAGRVLGDVEQMISSAATSRKQIAAAIKAIPWRRGATNADIGAGRFNDMTDALAERGVTNLAYDPFNRGGAANFDAVGQMAGGTDTATVLNVLNVIPEGAARANAIRRAAVAIKPGGTAYFQVYEGDGSGVGKATRDGWQENRKLASYEAEIRQYFGDVRRQGGVFVAAQPDKVAAGRIERVGADIRFMKAARKPSLATLLRRHGEQPQSKVEAKGWLGSGWRVFVAHELDEQPFEVRSVEMLDGYSTEQILGLPPGVGTDAGLRRSARPATGKPASGAGLKDIYPNFKAWFDAKSEVMGELPDREFYLEQRYLALGKIAFYERIADGIREAFDGISDLDKKQLYDYLTTAGAKTSALDNVKLRKKAEDTKHNINVVGDALEQAGLFGKTATDALQGKLFESPKTKRRFYDQYLPRMYLSHMLKEDDWRAIGAGKKPSDMGYLKQRQDIPEEVRRVILGEIKDPAYLSAMAIVRPMRDVTLLRFLETISKNESLVMARSLVKFDGHNVTPMWLKNEADRLRNQARYMEDRGDAAKAVALAERMDAVADPALDALRAGDHKDWRKLPDSPRYGRLRGLYVREEIYQDLVGVYEMTPEDVQWYEPASILGYGGTGTKITQAWKIGKVTLNPGSQVRNIVSNLVMLQLSGVSLHMVVPRVVQAIQEIASHGPYWKIALKYGVTEATFASQELMQLKKDAIRVQLESQDLHPMKRIMLLAGALARPVVEKASWFHQMMEQVGKTAKIIDEMKRGKTEAQAALEAQKWLFDYSLVPKSVRYLRNAPIGSPFLTWMYKSAPRLAEVAMFHPQRLLPWVGIMASLPYLAAMMVGGDDDDWRKMKEALPEWARKKGHVVAMPFRDSAGRIQFTDLGPFMPWTMWTDAVRNTMRGEPVQAAAGLGSSIISGGPIGSLFVALQTGVDPFTDREIVPKGEPPARAAAYWMSYLWTLAMPPVITEIGALGKGIQAAAGTTNKYGDPRVTGGQAAATLIGMNLYGINPDSTVALEVSRMNKETADARIRMSQQLQDRGLSPARRAEIILEYTNEMKRRNEKTAAYLQNARSISPELKVQMEPAR